METSPPAFAALLTGETDPASQQQPPPQSPPPPQPGQVHDGPPPLERFGGDDSQWIGREPNVQDDAELLAMDQWQSESTPTDIIRTAACWLSTPIPARVIPGEDLGLRSIRIDTPEGKIYNVGASFILYLANRPCLQGKMQDGIRPKSVFAIQTLRSKHNPKLLVGWNLHLWINDLTFQPWVVLRQLIQDNQLRMSGAGPSPSKYGKGKGSSSSASGSGAGGSAGDDQSAFGNFYRLLGVQHPWEHHLLLTSLEEWAQFGNARCKADGLTRSLRMRREPGIAELDNYLSPTSVMRPQTMCRGHKMADPAQVDYQSYVIDTKVPGGGTGVATGQPEEWHLPLAQRKFFYCIPKRYLMLLYHCRLPGLPSNTRVEDTAALRNMMSFMAAADPQRDRVLLNEYERLGSTDVRAVYTSIYGQPQINDGCSVTWRDARNFFTKQYGKVDAAAEVQRQNGVAESKVLTFIRDERQRVFDDGREWMQAICGENANCSAPVKEAMAHLVRIASTDEAESVFRHKIIAHNNLQGAGLQVDELFNHMENHAAVSTKHMHMMSNWWSAKSASDPDRKGKWHSGHVGDPALGKSMAIIETTNMRLPNTTLEPMHMSKQALAADINWDGKAIAMEEANPENVEKRKGRGGGSNTASEALYKNILTQGQMKSTVMVAAQDGSGKRQPRNYHADLNITYQMCMNLAEVTDAIRSRIFWQHWFLEARKGRTVGSLIGREALPAAQQLKKISRREFQRQHALILVLDQFIKAGAIRNVDTSIASMLLPRIGARLERWGIPRASEPRHFIRVFVFTRLLVKGSALHWLFSSSISPIRGKFDQDRCLYLGERFDMNQMRLVEPMLVDSLDTVVTAFLWLSRHEYQMDIRYQVLLALCKWQFNAKTVFGMYNRQKNREAGSGGLGHFGQAQINGIERFVPAHAGETTFQDVEAGLEGAQQQPQPTGEGQQPPAVEGEPPASGLGVPPVGPESATLPTPADTAKLDLLWAGTRDINHVFDSPIHQEFRHDMTDDEKAQFYARVQADLASKLQGRKLRQQKIEEIMRICEYLPPKYETSIPKRAYYKFHFDDGSGGQNGGTGGTDDSGGGGGGGGAQVSEYKALWAMACQLQRFTSTKMDPTLIMNILKELRGSVPFDWPGDKSGPNIPVLQWNTDGSVLLLKAALLNNFPDILMQAVSHELKCCNIAPGLYITGTKAPGTHIPNVFGIYPDAKAPAFVHHSSYNTSRQLMRTTNNGMHCYNVVEGCTQMRDYAEAETTTITRNLGDYSFDKRLTALGLTRAELVTQRACPEPELTRNILARDQEIFHGYQEMLVQRRHDRAQHARAMQLHARDPSVHPSPPLVGTSPSALGGRIVIYEPRPYVTGNRPELSSEVPFDGVSVEGHMVAEMRGLNLERKAARPPAGTKRRAKKKKAKKNKKPPTMVHQPHTGRQPSSRSVVSYTSSHARQAASGGDESDSSVYSAAASSVASYHSVASKRQRVAVALPLPQPIPLPPQAPAPATHQLLANGRLASIYDEEDDEALRGPFDEAAPHMYDNGHTPEGGTHYQEPPRTPSYAMTDDEDAYYANSVAGTASPMHTGGGRGGNYHYPQAPEAR